MLFRSDQPFGGGQFTGLGGELGGGVDRAVFSPGQHGSEGDSEEKPYNQGQYCRCAVAHSRIVAGRTDKAP